MEVKNIFVNLIMRNYDNHGVSRPMHAHAEPPEGDPARGRDAISPQAGKRLFGEIMEQSLQKGLSGAMRDES